MGTQGLACPAYLVTAAKAVIEGKEPESRVASDSGVGRVAAHSAAAAQQETVLGCRLFLVTTYAQSLDSVRTRPES